MKFKKPIAITVAAVAACGIAFTALTAWKDTARFTQTLITESMTRKSLAAGDIYVMSGLLFTELEDGTYEVGYDYNGSKPAGTLVIPEIANGRLVTRIAEAGFYGCGELKDITLPDSVTSAGANAFIGTALLNSQNGPVKYAGKLAVYCDDTVKNVTVKDGTLGLADRLFSWAEDLKSVSLPDSLVNLGAMTFDSCAKLTTVNIPSGVTEIGSGVFYGCSALSDVSIPSDVTRIGEYAFAETAITSADLSNVEKIGKGAFENTKLDANSVSVKDGYIDIGAKAFEGTEFYTSLGNEKYIGEVYLGSSKDVKKVSIREGTTAIADMAFSSCKSLTSVTIPKSVKTIGKDAFFNCTKLASVTIPEGVVSIGEDAFRLCESIASVSLPISLLSAGRGAFYGCDNIKTVTYPGSVSDMAAISGGDGDALPYAETVTLGSGSANIAPISGLSVTDTSYNTASLVWDKADLATGYRIEVNKNGEWSYAGWTDGTSFIVGGLDQCTDYEFRVFAGVHSVLSAPVTASAQTTLGPVTNVRAEPTDKDITLSWDKNYFADSYQVDMLQNGEWVKITKTVSGATTSCKITGLSPKNEYLFRIFTFRGDENGPAVNVSATTVDPNDLISVTGLSYTSEANRIKLTWDLNEDIDNYMLEMYKDGEWVKIIETPFNEFSIGGLAPDTSYDFRVYGLKGNQYGRAAGITATTKSSSTVKPTAVMGLTASADSDSVTLSWDKNSTAENYQIDMYKNGDWMYIAETKDTSYTITELSPNTSYRFRVFAFSGSQYSTSSKVTVSTKEASDTAASGKPEAVTGLSASANADSITLSWNENSAADSYQVDMYKNGEWVYVAKITDTSYTVTGLLPNTSYNFRVYAFSEDKYSSSSRITASTGAAASGKPEAVTGLWASSKSNSITLSWNESATADSYQIDIRKNGEWTYVARITGTAYTIEGLSPNTAYDLRVFAFNGDKYSSSSGMTVATSSTASDKPAAVTGLAASSSSDNITLSWNGNSAADSYQIDLFKNGKWEYVAKTPDTSYTVTGLSSNTSYKFRVFSFSGDRYSSSARLTASTTAVLAPPSAHVLAPSDNAYTSQSGARTMVRSIDVSGWQGVIDFNAVKESGVDIVIIKAGGGYNTVETWETNYANAKKAGLTVGAYWFSFATTLEEGKNEARAFLDAMKGKQLDFPVYFDMELSEQFDKGKDFCTRLVEAFCGELENAGYYAGAYCSTKWFMNLVSDTVRLKRPAWIADYRGGCYYDAAYGMWQYGVGEVSGVEFDCDLDWSYVDYSDYIRLNKLNGY